MPNNPTAQQQSQPIEDAKEPSPDNWVYNSGKGHVSIDDIAINLSQLVRRDKLADAFVRDKEIEKMFHILSRKENNNVMLIGREGSGKIAAIKGLAYRLVKNSKYANSSISGKDLWLLSKKYSGADFNASRIRGSRENNEELDVLQEFNGILCVPLELFSINDRSSSWLSGNHIMKILNICKQNRNMQVVLDYNITDYNRDANGRKFGFVYKHIKDILPLEDIVFEDYTDEEIIPVLKHEVRAIGAYHSVNIAKDAIDKALEYSKEKNDTPQYVPSLGYAKKLIDDTATRVKLRGSWNVSSSSKMYNDIFGNNVLLSAGTVTESDIVETYKQWNDGIGWKLDNTPKFWKTLERNVYEVVKGQDEAVNTVLKSIKIGYSPFTNAEKPVASFMFAGMTGTGKTWMSKTIAEQLKLPFLRIDMSEFYAEHTVARFIRAPPGYVGGGIGQLTNWVDQNENSFVLLDEIDKAHPKILDALLQVLDAGRLTSGTGKEVDMTKTIIAMTTNFGASDLTKIGRSVGFGEADDVGIQGDINVAVKKSLEKELRLEFINRFDEIIVFNKITPSIMQDLVKAKLDVVVKNAAENKVKVKRTYKLVALLAKIGYDETYGVRPLQREIDKLILFPLAELWTNGEIDLDSTVTVTSSLTQKQIESERDFDVLRSSVILSIGSDF